MSMGSEAGRDASSKQEVTGVTNSGLDENAATAVCYVLGWLTGFVMYFVESDTASVRSHAA